MADVILFLIITIITILTALYIHSKTKVVRTMIFNIQRWKGIKWQMCRRPVVFKKKNIQKFIVF